VLYSFFDVWHYEDNRRSYEVELRRWINFCLEGGLTFVSNMAGRVQKLKVYLR
jgi:hypothetical protein